MYRAWKPILTLLAESTNLWAADEKRISNPDSVAAGQTAQSTLPVVPCRFFLMGPSRRLHARYVRCGWIRAPVVDMQVCSEGVDSRYKLTFQRSVPFYLLLSVKRQLV